MFAQDPAARPAAAMPTTAMAGRNDMASPARDPAACLGPSSSDAAHPAPPPDGVANVVQSPSSNKMLQAALQTLLHHHHGDTLPVLLTSLMALLFTGFHGWHTSGVLVTSSEIVFARCTSSAGSRTVPQRPCPARATTCAGHWCLGPCDAQSHAGRRALGFTGKPFG